MGIFMKNLDKFIIKTLNEELNITSLNELQKDVIPEIEKKQNSILISKTGSGKTLCYLIPLLKELDFLSNNLQAIIVVPTKELVRQIAKILKSFKKYKDELTYIAFSDKSKDVELSNKNNVFNYQIVVCLPNKFEEITKYKNICSDLKTIVLDEADMTLDLGFFGKINQGFNNIPNINNIKKIATSATLHETLSNQVSKFFKNSKILNKSESIWENPNIKHYVIHYSNKDKKQVLLNLIKKLNPYFGIVFCNTKKEVNELYDFLYQNEIDILKLHGDLDNRKRKNVYKDAKNLKANILIATDLASRGLDIEGASHIISYDLPKEDVWYMHRAGRSGRKNYKGLSYVFNDDNSIYQITRMQRKGITWNNLKYQRNDFVDYQFVYKEKQKKETEVDRQIRDVINKSSKKVKPNYKKKVKLQIKEIKRKAKRNRIEELVNKERIKKYKIENAAKTREKQRQKELEERRLKKKNSKKNRRR